MGPKKNSPRAYIKVWSSSQVEVVKIEMTFSIVVFVAVLLSSLCVEGTLHYAKTKSGWNNFGDPYKKQFEHLQAIDLESKLESKILEAGKIRNKREGHVPVASTPFIFDGDSHRYANVHYSGEDSKVSVVILVFHHLSWVMVKNKAYSFCYLCFLVLFVNIY